MELSKNQLKILRARCHDLKPVIMLGQKGLTDAVLDETNIALEHHELVKIRIASEDREARKQMIDEICDRTDALNVQAIGKTVSIFKANPKKKDSILHSLGRK